MSAKGIKVEEEKVNATCAWPIPTNIREVQSFHRLAIFYKHFIRDFNTIVAPLIDCLKQTR